MVDLFDFNDSTEILNKILTEVPYQKQLKYNNYGLFLSKIYCRWLSLTDKDTANVPLS